MSHSCDSPLTEDFYKNGKLQLIIFAVLMLCSCASIKQADRKPVYEKELKEGKITRSDYNYLMQGQKELNKMNKDR